ncbi:MAG TPA: hypothetical protein VD838_18770 [Anaeromyxobacteraceae bacterium]|nr:hypothetical protein [Anaeromyxobacteraceae bacterium]
MADHESKVFDKRVAQRYVRKGIVDEKDWEKHVKSLPDLAEQAAPVEATMSDDDFDDDDLEDEEAGTPEGGAGTPPATP